MPTPPPAKQQSAAVGRKPTTLVSGPALTIAVGRLVAEVRLNS
jgi:hypothetical protein